MNAFASLGVVRIELNGEDTCQRICKGVSMSLDGIRHVNTDHCLPCLLFQVVVGFGPDAIDMRIVIRIVQDVGCILHCRHHLVYEKTLIGRTCGEIGEVSRNHGVEGRCFLFSLALVEMCLARDIPLARRGCYRRIHVPVRENDMQLVKRVTYLDGHGT